MIHGFKVVEKGTRNGTNWTMLKQLVDWENEYHKKSFKRKYKQFFPRYLSKTKIEMVPYSPGLMIFKNDESAERFICRENFSNYNYNFTIIDVFFKEEDILNSTRIAKGCGSNLYPFIYYENKNYTSLPAKGTIFVKELLVY